MLPVGRKGAQSQKDVKDMFALHVLVQTSVGAREIGVPTGISNIFMPGMFLVSVREHVPESSLFMRGGGARYHVQVDVHAILTTNVLVTSISFYLKDWQIEFLSTGNCKFRHICK